ncbi:MAG: class I SAM-dependent methyltransferase [Chloroflexota bacterium]|nr:class I SAM-dependent methyltransferase [Chloroflexota bacterium]
MAESCRVADGDKVGTRVNTGFWDTHQPGYKFTNEQPGTLEFFRAVEEHRYALEPHVRALARFPDWRGRDVLDVGCGLATDGIQFARHGARYTGLDAAHTAVEMARRRFELEGLGGDIRQGDATALPFHDDVFDLVYSHGVIHHIPDTREAVREIHRVLRAGGTALVMLYHRNSLNFYFNIMLVRRALAGFLAAPRAATVLSRLGLEDAEVFEGHRRLLREHGPRYLLDASLFLSHNTDGPDNPLSKVYTRDEARTLFRAFGVVTTEVRFLNLRLWPGGDQLSRTRAAKALERRIGWHLYVIARK